MQQQQNPYDISNIFPSNSLKGDDLLSSGPVVVEVEAVELKRFQRQDGQGEETKPQITFTDGMRMTCNRTQAGAIAKIAGSTDIRRWSGVQLMLIGIPTQLGKATIGVSKPQALPNAPRPAQQRPQQPQQAPRRPVAVAAAAPDWPDRDYDQADQVAGGVDDGGDYDPNIPF